MTRRPDGQKPVAEQPTLPQQGGDDDLGSAETAASVDRSPAAESGQEPTLPAPGAGQAVPASGAEPTVPASGEPGVAQALSPGQRFGEFQMLEPLGEGGMGTVFAAHDPNLDRRVAIKVLRAGAGGSEAQERLVREAQAMAQLSHPNVITVHQVGTRGGQVFVVMEHVDGGTLRQWLERGSHSWREVLETFVAAGRGLAAAHHAGLVHRDFKPDNVLLRSDGRVLVTDFGLVAATGADIPGGRTSPSLSGSSSSRLATDLTRAGAVMGTPLYMAPEQHRGERADARADQFAFCVALYEALHGERPFGGITYKEVRDAVLHGEVRPPSGSDVPRWLHDVVARGLERDREQRYPDMDALLAALGSDPSVRRRRRIVGAGGAALLLGLAGLLVWLWPASGSERCEAAGDKLAEVWSEKVRADLRSNWPARQRIAPVIAGLDRFGAAWARERKAACEATYVRGEQSERLLDRRMLCLDRKLGMMAALVTGLRSPDPTVAHGAAMAAARLPRLESCRDRAALSERLAAPQGQGESINAAWQQTDRAVALRELGKLEEAAGVAGQAVKRADELGFAPLQARARYVAGTIRGRRGDHAAAEQDLREAIRKAGEGRDYHVEAEAWLTLIYLVGHEDGRPAIGLAMAPAAEAAVARVSRSADLRGRLEGNLGLILMSQGAYAGARTRLERSLEIFAKAYGEQDLDTTIARNNLAILLERSGAHREAYAQLKRVLAVRRRLLGEGHPAVATTLNDLGNSAHSLGLNAEARRHLERALAIRTAALGEKHLRTAHTLNNLAIVLGDTGQHESAAQHARRAVAVIERTRGKDDPELAGPLNTLGDQLRAQGLPRPAWEAYARGLAIIEKARGGDHVEVAPLVENLARMLVQLGHLDRGIQFIDRAFAVRSASQGRAHPMTINAIALRGSFNLQGKRFDAAAADFQRQRDLAREAFGDHPETAQAEYNVAVALEQAGKNAPAERHYRAALAILAKAAPRHRFVANVWRGLGDLAAARKDLEAAEGHYRLAVESAESSHNPGLADMLHLLGTTAARRGRHAEAAKVLERAVTARGGGDVALLALEEFALARVLWDGKLDRGRAVKLARHARRLFASAGERAEDNVKEVDAWLRGRAR